MSSDPGFDAFLQEHVERAKRFRDERRRAYNRETLNVVLFGLTLGVFWAVLLMLLDVRW